MDCGTFSAKQWADGIALAGLASFPLTQQSEKLLGLLRAKAAESAKLRVIAWSEDIAFPEGRPDVIAIDDVEKRLQALQQKSTPGFATAVQNRLSRYRQCKEQELDIRQHMKALEAEAATLSVVPKIHIEVQPVVAEGK